MYFGVYSLLAHSNAIHFCEIYVLKLFICLNKGRVTLKVVTHSEGL